MISKEEVKTLYDQMAYVEEELDRQGVEGLWSGRYIKLEIDQMVKLIKNIKGE